MAGGEGEGSSKLKEVYGECQRNHSASLGVYSKDGCGEFICEQGGKQCVACGCHRNFHRKIIVVPEEEKNKKKKTDGYIGGSSGGTANVVVGDGEDLGEVPIELIDYDVAGGKREAGTGLEQSERKSRRTFTEEQKERMRGFAEMLGWRMPKKYDLHEDEMQRFCQTMDINRNTFKIWMHNQKKHFIQTHPPSN